MTKVYVGEELTPLCVLLLHRLRDLRVVNLSVNRVRAVAPNEQDVPGLATSPSCKQAGLRNIMRR